MKLTQSRSQQNKLQAHHSFHDLPHHKISHWPNIIIWGTLTLIFLILVIYILGSPIIIAPRTLEYHPLFTYFEHEFKINKLNPKRLFRELFPLKITAGKSKTLKSQNKIKYQNIINIAFENATQSHHFDNWLFLGDYISFLVNKENKIVQKKIITHKFSQLYSRLKYHNEDIDDQVEFEIDRKIAQKNEAALFRFSDKFQNILESEDLYIENLRQKTFMEKVKDFIDGYIIGFHDYFEDHKENKEMESFEQNRVWILWLLHLQGQQLKGLRKQFSMLQKKYPTDKFIVLSLYPIFRKQSRSIKYHHENRESFKNLLKSYINSSEVHSTLISKHFEYSLLELSHYVKDQQSFTMYHLAGGRLGYCDLQKIPFWVLDKVEKLCKGQKVKTQKMMLQEQKYHFYRMGIYKLGSEILWKNKQARNNYEFQTGKLCKRIPIFHNDYLSLFQTFKKTYFGLFL